MGRLKGQHLEYIFGNLKAYHRLARKDRLWFKFGNAQAGLQGHAILKETYADKYVTSGDVGNYTDFNMKFADEAAATFVLDDIDGSLAAYALDHPGAVVGGSDDPGTVTGTGGKKKSDNTIVYIIAGVAAAAAIALLMPWKKK